MEAEPHLGLQGHLLKTQERQSQGGFFLACLCAAVCTTVLSPCEP